MSEERWTIPASWDWATAGDIARIVGGGTPSSKVEGNFAEEGIPWITPADLTGYRESHISRGRRDLSEQGFAGSGAQLIPAGSVLFSSRAPIGYCVIARNEVSTNQGFKSLVLDGEIDPSYIRHYLLSAKEYAESKASGTTFMELSGARVAELAIPIAPLPEQQRIAAKVDGLTARTARARKELDRIPTLIARYKQRLLALALAGEQTIAWRISNGKGRSERRTEVIETPARFEMSGQEDWKFLTIGDVCRIEGGSQPPKSTFVYEPRPGYVRLIQIRDYKSDKHIVFIPKELARRFAAKTDIMIGRYGPPIFQILRGLQGAYNVALMKAVPNEEIILPDFLFWFLKGPTLLSYVELDSKRSSGQDGVNKDHLLKFPVPLPTIEEQAEIVRRIESAFGWLDRVAADHDAAARLLPKLDAAILAKAFQGKLVPQDPNDEPAAKLLERINAEREAAPKEKRGRKARKTVSLKDLQTMAKNLEQVLAEAGDWISAQDAFQLCGIGGAATTDEIEKIYAELRKLDKAGKLEAEPVNDDQGRKLHDRLRLKAA